MLTVAQSTSTSPTRKLITKGRDMTATRVVIKKEVTREI
jgi:hypothetical protein